MIIDCQHHYFPKEQLKTFAKCLRPSERIEIAASHPSLPGVNTVAVVRDNMTVWNIPPIYTDLKAQIQEMNEQDVDIAILSTGLGQEWITLESARAIDDSMAKAMLDYPGRFLGLAHVPQLGDEGIEELDRAVKDLHLKGASVMTNVEGIYPDGEQWQPFLAKCEELRIPIVAHATALPFEHDALKSYNKQEYTWARIVGRAYDLTVFTMRVLTSGILKRYPNLKFCIAHTGGTFFALKNVYVKRHIDSEGTIENNMKRLYFDTSIRSNEMEIRTAIELLGAEQLVFATDFPYWSSKSYLKFFENLDPKTKEMILSENAKKLFEIDIDDYVVKS